MTNFCDVMILNVWKSGLPFSLSAVVVRCVNDEWWKAFEELLYLFYKLLHQGNSNSSTIGWSLGSPWCGCEGDRFSLLVSLCPSNAEWLIDWLIPMLNAVCCADWCWEGSTLFPPPVRTLQHNRTCTLHAWLSQYLYFIPSFNASWTNKQISKRISLFPAANLEWCQYQFQQ